MKRRKPSGKHGVMHVGRPGRGKVTFHDYPATKDEIERYYVELVFRASPEARAFYGSNEIPIQNSENNHDFTLSTPSGPKPLELMESSPLEQLGTTYDDAPASYSNGEFADMIWENIQKKSHRYTSGVNILIYPTDGKLQLTENVCNLLAFRLSKEQHQLASVTYTSALPEGHDCQFVVLYPRAENAFDSFHEKTVRRGSYAFADFSKAEFSNNGKTVTIPLGKLKADDFNNSEITVTIRGRKA